MAKKDALTRTEALLEIDHIVDWTRRWYAENACPGTKILVGISGGKDSTVTAALLVKALGTENVIGVLMPNVEQNDIQDSYRVVAALGIQSVKINIGPAVNALYAAMVSGLAEAGLPCELGAGTLMNTPPRIRMAALYGLSQTVPGGGRVANTCNRSEDFLGYSTKNGDAAGDFGLLSNYLATQVISIGRNLLVLPCDLVEKAPADGLCGKTDEDNFGFTYEELDAYLQLSDEERQESTWEHKEKAERMHKASLHKVLPMPKA